VWISARRRRLAVGPWRYFAADEVERARRYHRPLYWAAAAGLALEVGVLAALAWSGAGGALDPASLPWWARTLAYAAIVVALAAGVQTPLAFWRGYLREGRWGFSTQTLGGWFSDRLEAVAVNVALAASVVLALVALVRALPGWWVVPAAAAFALWAFVLSFLAPLLLAPLFDRYRPLQEPLRSELLALASAAAVPVERVLVEDTSRRTRKANAYVTGLGRTRRVVVSDTLLAAAPASELRGVVAHELGHRRARHVLLGTLLTAGGAVAATVVVWALLGVRVAEPQQLPRLVLLALALAVAAMPVLAAISRRWERRADRYAVALTNDRAAYASVLRRLTVANLSDLDPPILIYLFLFTHPTAAERLAASGATDVQTALAAPAAG
jgi:STE24 endopeptidase